MTYSDTIDFLYSQLPVYQKIGIKAYKKDLTNIKILCDSLGNPQNQFRSIHVAGTNGKGSTSYLLAAICQAAGYSTGLYTSPHLIDFRERIKINGKLIPKNSVIQFVKKIKPVIFEIEPSFFEITVAMAFYYFAQQKVDVAVIETGLGGRLDSTNIIKPILSVITNIALEHQNILGDTLALIAYEKAGIIKPNIPVVIGQQQNETAPVFEKVAKERNSTLIYAQNMFHVTKVTSDIDFNTFTISNTYNNFLDKYDCELKGVYQSENIVTTLASIATINQITALSISEKAIKKGIRQVVSSTNFLGRWQTIQNEPRIIVDCAHNAAGIASIFENRLLESFESLRIVFGCVADKDLNEVVRFLPKHAFYYITQPNNERARPFQETSALFKNADLNVVIQDAQPVNTLSQAKKDADKNDLVLVIGSVFLVADVLESLK